MTQFGRAGRRAERIAGTSVRMIDGADHMLHMPDARAQFLHRVCREIAGEPGAGDPPHRVGAQAGGGPGLATRAAFCREPLAIRSCQGPGS